MPKKVDASQRLEQLLERDYQRRESEDTYRNLWSWDSTVKVTHSRANCGSSCSLVAYIKDGKVWREEQNTLYEQTTPEVPDANPRGCTGGCIYSSQMYDETRIKHPVKRVGPRGSGQWERISWDQALEEIADKLLDVAVEHGSECVVYETGSNTDLGLLTNLEGLLFGEGIGGVTLDIMTGTGDLPIGLLQTWGAYMSEGTADDWFHADYIINWLGNPAYTHQTDIHYQYEARYRGAKLVSIAPDFSPSTVHADLWLNVRIGSDAALALGMVNVILQEKLYKVDYIKEQTDLPFLIRTDTGRYLRGSDLEEGGADDIFYFWNTKTGCEAKAPGTWGSDEWIIALDEGIDPALEGEFTVNDKDGQPMQVRPVFELVRERAAEYPLDRVAEITTIPGENVARVAREFAQAKAAMIWTSWGAAKLYHSDLYVRGMAYLTALTGHSGGKPGTGIRAGTFWPQNFPLAKQAGPGESRQRLNTEPVPESPVDRIPQMAIQKAMSRMTATTSTVPLIPFLYVHDPKFREVASKQEYNDPSLTRSVDDYMQDCMDKGWQPVWPKPPKRPRFYWFSGNNPLRRWPNPGIIRDSLWKSLDTIVAFDIRWNTSTMWSDYVLPAAGWYEKPATKYYYSYTHHIHVGEQAVPPLHESKNEYDLVMLLAKKIQERAIARDIDEYSDPFNRAHIPKTLYDDITADGVYAEGLDGMRRALDFILKNSDTTRNNTELGENYWESAAELGGVKPVSIKPSALIGGCHSDYTPDETISPMGWFTQMKNSWPTLTGRQQFLLDHDWFFEAGESLLVHKEPPSAGGKYPIRLTGGHNRNSIQSNQMAFAPALQLQRGEPAAYVAVADAEERGIEDGDRIRVFNDLASFEVIAKVAASVRPGMITIYNAWEGYQFKEWRTQNDLQVNPPKPTNMVGEYGHLFYRPAGYTMNHIPKEVSCDFEKAEAER
ncbi:MAG: molybdopterin-dependent oxidoreductase [Gammaproteobacteria bacterium]|jgi:DMSO reductase family type II enzyme molybdopterin subunit|nr:molybdopterin-dependent oxidoreductase [Gammaproteobacteria bacterium]MBT4495027.1 molybdopterin-dependent oxidoreductase [Gammaproteobacteria bacterium]MBT7369256.1 molybdopterin-dependent oxidoreductase [Gammaproteobacteria bacterium]